MRPTHRVVFLLIFAVALGTFVFGVVVLMGGCNQTHTPEKAVLGR
jgi:hypothetical protein